MLNILNFRFLAFVAVAMSASVLVCEAKRKLGVADLWNDKEVQSLARAGAEGRVAEIDRIVAAGVDINKVGMGGYVPLAYTMVSANKVGFSKLLSVGADPNVHVDALPGGDGTLVGLAAQAIETFWLEELAAAGADLNLRSKRHKRTPLYYAVAHRRHENVKFLLKQGVAFDDVERDGYTLLQFAVIYANWEGTYLLVEAGADWDRAFPKGGKIPDKILEFYKPTGRIRSGPHWMWRNKLINLLIEKGSSMPETLRAEAAK